MTSRRRRWFGLSPRAYIPRDQPRSRRCGSMNATTGSIKLISLVLQSSVPCDIDMSPSGPFHAPERISGWPSDLALFGQLLLRFPLVIQLDPPLDLQHKTVLLL